MASFVANKYDKKTDPHLPKVGTTIEGYGKIMKVQPIEAGKLMKLMQKEEDLKGFKKLLVGNNPDRPFLKYLIWVN